MESEKTTNFSTSCGTCVFATHNNNTQVGCEIGRLEKFQKLGKTELDPTQTFFIIKTVCNTCRGQKWAQMNVGNNLIAAVEKEVQITLDFVILSIDDKVDKLQKNLPDMVNMCLQQKHIKPKNIICVVRNTEINYSNLYDDIRDLTSVYGIPFQIVRVLDNEADILKCFDMGVVKCKSRYFASFMLTDNIPSNLIAVLNTKLNNDLIPVSMVEPYSQFSGMVLQTVLYKILGKNYNMPIFEKVREQAEIQDKQENILTWEQLWNYRA